MHRKVFANKVFECKEVLVSGIGAGIGRTRTLARCFPWIFERGLSRLKPARPGLA